MFTFNVYSGLLLIGWVQAMVYALILFRRGYREERVSDYLAAFILLTGACYVAQWMLGFGGWYDERDWRTTVMFYIKWNNLAALGPLIWFYFRAVTNTDFRWRRKYWLHFIPFFLFLLPFVGYALIDWVYFRGLLAEPFCCFSGSRGPAQEWKNSGGGIPWYIEDVFVRLQLIVYLLITIRDYRSYRRYLQVEFSNPDILKLTGLRNTVYLLLGGLAITLAVEIREFIFTIQSYTDVWTRYFSMSVLIFLAAIQFHTLDPRRTRILRFSGQEVGPEDERPSDDPDPELVVWSRRLSDRLESYRDFLDPELKLGELATRMGTNASVLSRVINSHFGKNFNDFINAYRCAAFLERLRQGDHQHHTLLSIALDCGFNSKSTFNRAFRKVYGYPPGEATQHLGANHNSGPPES